MQDFCGDGSQQQTPKFAIPCVGIMNEADVVSSANAVIAAAGSPWQTTVIDGQSSDNTLDKALTGSGRRRP